jgi:hypothetical protein
MPVLNELGMHGAMRKNHIYVNGSMFCSHRSEVDGVRVLLRSSSEESCMEQAS